MKILNFGYEANMDSNSATVTANLPGAIVIKGIVVSLGCVILKTPGMPLIGGIFDKKYAENTHSEILWQILVSGLETDQGIVSTLFNSLGANTIHGGAAGGDQIASGIVKTWITNPPTSCQMSDRLVNMGLDLAVPTGQHLTIAMNHDGYPCDAEMQGGLFYESAA